MSIAYTVELCTTYRLNDQGLINSKKRYYVVKHDGKGRLFKERISKERFQGFERQANRTDCFHGNTTKGVVRQYKTLYFGSVPTLYG